MPTSQVGCLWSFVDLLSSEDSQLFKDPRNPSVWDADSDLCLRSTHPNADEKVSFRFILPATRYEFIEIDAVSLGADTGLSIAAVANYSEQSFVAGETVQGTYLVTSGRLRTYRLPFIGEIEAFVFSGFKSSAPINIKQIRFFTRSDRLHLVTAPEPIPPDLVVNAAFLERDGISQTREPDGSYPIVIASGETANLNAIFTMDGITRSYGLIRLRLSTDFFADCIYTIRDQTGLSQTFDANGNEVDIFVTTEFQSINISAFNTATVPTSDVIVSVELFFFKLLPNTSAFGIADSCVVFPLAGIGPCVPCSGTGDLGTAEIPTGPGTGGGGGPGPGGGGTGTPFSGSIEYTIPGTYIWTPPIGVISPISVSGVGNGGAGGGGTTLNTPKGAGGGGSGEEITNQPLTVSAGVPITIVIPPAAQPVTGSDGNDGGDVTINTTAIVLHGGKGGKNTGVGGVGGGTLGGAAGNFNTPTGGSGSAGTVGTLNTGGAGGGGAGSTGTANGGPGGSAGSFAGGSGGSAAGGGAGGGGGGATSYAAGAKGGDGKGDGTPGTNNAHIRLVQLNTATGYGWFGGGSGTESAMISSWIYPGMVSPIRIFATGSATTKTYDPTTLNFIGDVTAVPPTDQYPDIINLSDATWWSGGYHIKTDGTRIPLYTSFGYQIGNTTTNPALVGGTITGSLGFHTATMNFGFAAGIPAGEWLGGLVSSTDYKETYVFTAPTQPGGAIVNKWYKIVNAVVVAQGTVSPAVDTGLPGVSGRTYVSKGWVYACFENGSPYCWICNGAGTRDVWLYSINAAGNFALDPIGGSMTAVLPGTFSHASLISPGLGYAAIAAVDDLMVFTRWATDIPGASSGVGGGGGGGGINTSGGEGGIGRIKLSWNGITP